MTGLGSDDVIKLRKLLQRTSGSQYRKYYSSDLVNLFGFTSLTQAGTAGRVFITLCTFLQKATISAITGEVTTSGGVGTFLRLGIYEDQGGRTPVDGDLLFDSGNIAADATGVKTATLTTPLVVEKYRSIFLALETEDAVVVFRRVSLPVVLPNATEVGWGCRYDRGGGFGAFTNPCPAVTQDNNINPWSFVIVEAWDE